MTERLVVPHLTITGGATLTGYPYFWIKAVTGFDPSNHCARCLKGHYVFTGPKMCWQMNRAVSLDLKGARLGYICGVTTRGWATNLHIPFRPKLGSVVEAELPNRQQLRLVDAEKLDIRPLPNGWKGFDRSFTTCRNFQFGVQYFGHHRLTARPEQLSL